MFSNIKRSILAFICMVTLCSAVGVRADVMIDEEPAPVAKIDQKAPVTTVTGEEVTVTTSTTVDPNLVLPICSQCNAKIPSGRHYISMKDGRNFCSQTCYKKALPKCSICSATFEKGLQKDGFLFCSRTCLEATFPKCQCCKMSCKIYDTMPENMEVYCPTCLTYTRCSSCGRPDRIPVDLKDGRFNCRECNKTAVVDKYHAEKLLKDVNVLMGTKLGFHASTAGIAFELCSPAQLRKKTAYANTGDEPGAVVVSTRWVNGSVDTVNESGKTVRERTRTMEVAYTIMILDNLSIAKFKEVVAHELAVLWLYQNYPYAMDLGNSNSGNPVIREGFGEWAAAQVNILNGNEKMNVRIRNNPSAYYGKGYRLVKERIEQSGFDGFKKYLNVLNSPSRVPTAN